MPVLRLGSTGEPVRLLQARLNEVLAPSPNLRVSGHYDAATQRAVTQFQTANWLGADGIAGPCTENALYGWETFTPILHNVRFISQPTATTCWAASTAMMTNSSVNAVQFRTPAHLVGEDGGLRNYSATDDLSAGTNAFARANHLHHIAPRSWSVSSLRQHLSRGPLMFDILWDSEGYNEMTNRRAVESSHVPPEYVGSEGHMIVVIGSRGTEDPTGQQMTLRIYDPWPPGRGRMVSVSYARYMRRMPTGTYRVFHR